MALYFATVLPGLEPVLADEMQVKIGDASIHAVERGKVYFASERPLPELMLLRTADNLYEVIHSLQVGPNKIHLTGLERELSRCGLPPAAAGLRTGPIRYKVNASRTGRHSYSRYDAADAAARGIARRDSRYQPVQEPQRADVEFRLDIRHRDAVFSLKLTDAVFRYRQAERQFTQAALRPTVAHALVWLSNPEPSDLFLDPCCGSGAILAERLPYPCQGILGGDWSAAAVEAAQANTGIHPRVRIQQWDARQLPLDAGSVDKLAANLPFGRQIAAEGGLAELYTGMFKEMQRVLKPQGSALCLTDAGDALQQAAEQARLQGTAVASLSLKGLHPTLYRLRKT